ncbi:metallophosphoesterase family protein [Chitinophaga agri]|uniref:Uncharacterized protein n=1 Tax=Chitinophaga agri TaxID=2703787 RepID=A0A6B9ZIU2_9BACT|nr:hypothetical protein [Chitinophaga agri]QHS61887.1 hypothetical protein GWR21_20455 [Chitinophaga agri]
MARIRLHIRVPGKQEHTKHFSVRLQKNLINEPIEFNCSPEIIFLSNITHNFASLQKTLLKEEIIDKHYKWTFSNKHIVIIEDFETIEEERINCLWLLYSLEEKAKKQGGYIHLILSNYNSLLRDTIWRNSHPNYAMIESLSLRSTNTVLYDGNNELWRWLKTKNVVEKIGTLLIGHSTATILSTELSDNFKRLNKPYHFSLKAIEYVNKIRKTNICSYNEDEKSEKMSSPREIRSDKERSSLSPKEIFYVILGQKNLDTIEFAQNDNVILLPSLPTTERRQTLYFSNNQFYITQYAPSRSRQL